MAAHHMNVPETPALDLLNKSLPASQFQNKAALHHFSELTAANSLNAAIFGGHGSGTPGALQRQLTQTLEGCVGAVGELRARVASLEAAKDSAEARADAAERRAARGGVLVLWVLSVS